MPGSPEAGTGNQRLVIGAHHRSTPTSLARLPDSHAAPLRERPLRPIFVITPADPADAARTPSGLGGGKERTA